MCLRIPLQRKEVDMIYSFALNKHANIRYRDAVCRLSRYELQSMLKAMGVDVSITEEEAGGADFISFDCRELSKAELNRLSHHSCVSFMAEKVSGLLRPLSLQKSLYLPEDLPEVLKYKGKTSVPFTRMMIHMAHSVSSFANAPFPVTLMDPLCGRGTACFCALMEGMNAIGLDTDQKALREAGDYFERYLKYHQLKHAVSRRSETVGRASLPVTEFVFADSREHYQQGETRSLQLSCGDTALVPALVRRHPVHLMVADLPYGIQHAPQSGQKPESFSQLLRRAIPAWKAALLPGGAMALSFNTLTLPRHTVMSLLEEAQLVPLNDDSYSHLRHEVEQAVVRDVIFAVKKS